VQADGTLLVTSRSGDSMRYRKATRVPASVPFDAPVPPDLPAVPYGIYWPYLKTADGVWWEQIDEEPSR
jgi:hypothetical protein